MLAKMKILFIQRFLQKEFPKNQMLVESYENKFARLLFEIAKMHICPRVRISQPKLMLMNEISVYAEIVSTEDELVLALTINVSINFSSKPKPDLNLLGE